VREESWRRLNNYRSPTFGGKGAIAGDDLPALRAGGSDGKRFDDGRNVQTPVQANSIRAAGSIFVYKEELSKIDT